MYGKQHSEETKDKIRNSMVGKTNHSGKKHSEETKRKMSESAKRRWERLQQKNFVS